MSGCWVPGAAGSGFDVDHLPYGAYVVADGVPARLGVRVGEWVLDLAEAVRRGDGPGGEDLAAPVLNPLLAAGPRRWAQVRAWLQQVLVDPAYADRLGPLLVPVSAVRTVLAWEVADYVDFYCSEHHATNVGHIFRPDSAALPVNWKHLPIGYHGRSGTVVVSGHDVVRPSGQRRVGEDVAFGPTQRLDLEAEVGYVVGVPTVQGTSVSTDAFAEHVFGVVLLNDWSARDIQAWEYVPLGPFLGKSFATSVAAWVTPLAALEAARTPLPGQDPPPLPYLEVAEPAGYALDLEVVLDGEVVARPPYASTYWSPAQMLAHLTVNGASLRTGDLFASGTVSGPERAQRGSFLELSWGGREPFTAGGRERTFLEDGDEVVLRGSATSVSGGRLELGEVRGRVLPAG